MIKMIIKDDITKMLEIIEKHEETINNKKLYDKLTLILKGINLQEELNKNSEELQKIVDKENEKKGNK